MSQVYSFGCNDEGALGRITEGKEGAEFKAERVDLPASVVQISAGDSHSAALSEDGVVYIWGMFRVCLVSYVILHREIENSAHERSLMIVVAIRIRAAPWDW